MIVGKKTILRNIKKEDLKILRDWRNSSGIRDFNTQYILLNIKNQNCWYDSISRKNSERKMFMILDKQNKRIGICGLIHIDKENRNSDVAIIIGKKDIHGKGFGSDSLRTLLNYGFKELKMHRIGAEILEFNKKSISFFEKLNFKYEAELKRNLWRNGRWYNTLVYSILKNEFK